MIKTPLSIALGGAFWTPGATVIGGNTPTFDQQIQKLFANNEQGFYYDPNDLSTMFQDANGTVPVTAVGQAVGLILDKSGRNNHAYQSTSASRPILRNNAVTGANYLEFDGSDDFLQTANIDFTATDKVSLFVGVRKLSDATTAVFLEYSKNINTNIGSFNITAPNGNAATTYAANINGGSSNGRVASGYVAPVSNVLSIQLDTSKNNVINAVVLRVNSITPVLLGTGVTGTGNYGNYPLYIGRRAGTTLPFNGHIYSLVGIGKLASDNETVAIEKELSKRLGVTINV